MRKVLFLCDGASTPTEWRGKWTDTDYLVTKGERSTVNFNIKPLEASLHGMLDGRSFDLVRIAGLALAADQSVSRGGDRDPTNTNWHRNLGLVIPVNEPGFWSEPRVLSALRQCIGFVSDDDWDFRFTQGETEATKQLALGEEVRDGAEADVVIPFSGGIDSLTAVVEALQADRRVLLISHSSANVPEKARQELLAGLRQMFPTTAIGRVRAQASRVGSEAVERTNRSRSFFYASLAAVVANRLRTAEVYLADNGWVSVNPRINDQLVGTLATRSTHPRFLRLFAELARLVFEHAPPIQNPFWNQTRADVMKRLQGAGGERLLHQARSCAAGRNLRRETPHCGRCSQCIDRRFASIATDLMECDPADAYAFDIFSDELPPLTESLALSYVRAARKIERLSNDDLFLEFPELAECLGPDDGEEEAYEYISMFRRQAGFVLAVVQQQMNALVPRLTRGDAGARSLIALLAAEQSPPTSGVPDIVSDDDFINVAWREQSFVFNPTQAAVVRNLFRAHENGQPVLTSERALAGTGREHAKMSDVFKGHPAWKSFIVLVGRHGYRLASDSPNLA